MSEDDRARPHEDERKDGLTRRTFLKVSGIPLSAAMVLGPRVVEAAGERVPIHGPGKAKLALIVNGRKRTVEVEPRVTLLEALRDELDLTGAKRVCDRGTCGACTVILGDKPVYSCSILAIDAQAEPITTVESLASAAGLHSLQQAFIDNDAQQCGFCTPGFLMACKALLDQAPDPTPGRIQEGLGGNLCRCGTYQGIRAAVLQIASARRGGARHG